MRVCVCMYVYIYIYHAAFLFGLIHKEHGDLNSRQGTGMTRVQNMIKPQQPKIRIRIRPEKFQTICQIHVTVFRSNKTGNVCIK